MADPVFVAGNSSECGIHKRVLTPPKQVVSKYEDNTKMTFHFVARLCDETHTILDDSKNQNQPFELILGRKFKLEVWETCVKSMNVGEVSSFTVDKQLASSYPIVARSLRNMYAGKPVSHTSHCCGGQMQTLGYSDLDALMEKPQDIEFIIELLKVEEPGGYKKDVWAMNEEEKLAEVAELRERGNGLYRQKEYGVAADCYGKAIGVLEQLLLGEKPNNEEWKKLNDLKLPLLLNFAQCKLSLQDFYPVIEHTTEVLKFQPENSKALYRRAKALIATWEPDAAKRDLEALRAVDASLEKTVAKELRHIDALQKEKDARDRQTLQGKLF